MRFIAGAVTLALMTSVQWVEAKPVIVGRSDWGAQPAHEELMRRQVPTAIIIHHTGERRRPHASLEKKLRNLQKFSMRAGYISETGRKKPVWGDVPYHFYVDHLGRIGEGRPVLFAGDTNTGYKTDGYIQVVVEGHFDREKPTLAQLSALGTLVIWLATTYGIVSENITGHDEHASTDCPGRNLKPHLDALRKSGTAITRH